MKETTHTILRTVLRGMRFIGFLAVATGLMFRVLHWVGGNQLILAGGALMLLALLGHLINGGWAMSQADEKVRLAGHLLILYGFSTYLSWFSEFPMGLQAILSGILLLGLATWLRRRQAKEISPEERIEEIGRPDESDGPLANKRGG